MGLFATALTREVKKLHENNIQLRIVGDLSAFSDKIRKLIDEALLLTSNNDGLILNVAANYGGRWDITQATQKIAQQVQAGLLAPEDINEGTIEKHLSLKYLPEPDLFIRTGGEKRVSNFILWHLAYCEFYFTDILWPDFNKETFLEAIDSFHARQRRFGRTGDQLKTTS